MGHHMGGVICSSVLSRLESKTGPPRAHGVTHSEILID